MIYLAHFPFISELHPHNTCKFSGLQIHQKRKGYHWNVSHLHYSSNTFKKNVNVVKRKDLFKLLEDGRERGAKGESIVTKADDIPSGARDAEERGGALLLKGCGDLFGHHLKLHFQIYQVFFQWILWVSWLTSWVYPFFGIKFLIGEGTQIHHCRRSTAGKECYCRRSAAKELSSKITLRTCLERRIEILI